MRTCTHPCAFLVGYSSNRYSAIFSRSSRTTRNFCVGVLNNSFGSLQPPRLPQPQPQPHRQQLQRGCANHARSTATRTTLKNAAAVAGARCRPRMPRPRQLRRLLLLLQLLLRLLWLLLLEALPLLHQLLPLRHPNPRQPFYLWSTASTRKQFGCSSTRPRTHSRWRTGARWT